MYNASSRSMLTGISYAICNMLHACAEPRPSSPAPDRGSVEGRRPDVNREVAHSQKGLSGFLSQVQSLSPLPAAGTP